MKFWTVLLVSVAACVFGSRPLFAQDATLTTLPQTLPVKTLSTTIPISSRLPPSPPGVTTVEWTEFLKMPVGPFGYEITDRIKSLDGKRVRILGYMVKREEPVPGSLLLAPMPVSVEEDETGFGDLPPQAVRVLLPFAPKKLIEYTSRPLLLTGILSVGVRAEPGETVSGTVSLFRLILDKPAAPVSPEKTHTRKISSTSRSSPIRSN